MTVCNGAERVLLEVYKAYWWGVDGNVDCT